MIYNSEYHRWFKYSGVLTKLIIYTNLLNNNINIKISDKEFKKFKKWNKDVRIYNNIALSDFATNKLGLDYKLDLRSNIECLKKDIPYYYRTLETLSFSSDGEDNYLYINKYFNQELNHLMFIITRTVDFNSYKIYGLELKEV